MLRGHFGTRLTVGGAGADGRVAVEIGFGSLERAGMELAGYGSGLEVIDPPSVRIDLAAIGRHLAERYAGVS